MSVYDVDKRVSVGNDFDRFHSPGLISAFSSSELPSVASRVGFLPLPWQQTGHATQ